MRTLPSKAEEPFTSKSPLMRRSLAADMEPCDAASVPNLLYETEVVPPTWRAPPITASSPVPVAKEPTFWKLVPPQFQVYPMLARVTALSRVSSLIKAPKPMESEATPKLLSSSPQKNRLVVVSQPRALVSASQSAKVAPVLESVR